MRIIGVDVGGTFTDITFVDTVSNIVGVHKMPTTTADPSMAIAQGIGELCLQMGVDISAVDHVFHGTTIATNAILEHNGANVGMITNRGYRDIVHIGRHQRPHNYSIIQDIPWQSRPLVRRRNRKTVSERVVMVDGAIQVETPLNEDEVREALNYFRENDVESVSVCFLFSYLHPYHELRVKEIIRDEYPEFYSTVSSDISPQFREFERFTTACLNAFVGPVVRDYMEKLRERLRSAGFRSDPHIMCSNGGVATVSTVIDKPVFTMLSGPAAGVLGGQWAGNLSKRERLITFDVGGTSADIAIITDQGLKETSARDTWIAGFPVQIPMIDIHTIGAGGGSIASVDLGGAFQVGPKSAGSTPGPACYGHGGDQPTVTDAQVVLGRLDPEQFLGGGMNIYPENSQVVIARLASQLSLGLEQTAEGILTVLNHSMANAIRAKTIEKGYDPRKFSLVALGGAGPMHAAEVAQVLGIPEVIVPHHPGITSAMGLLTTDVKYDAVQTLFVRSDIAEPDRLASTLSGLEAQLRTQLHQDGFEEEDIKVDRYMDCRYVGQGYELRIPVAFLNEDLADLAQVWEEFHTFHQREYGHAFRTHIIEVVNVRVTASGSMPKLGHPHFESGKRLIDAVVKREQTTFRVSGELRQVETVFYRRDRLPVNAVLSDPCVILQRDTTTVVPPGCSAVLDDSGNLVIRIGV